MQPISPAPAGAGYRWYVIAVLLLAQTFSFLDRMIMGLLVGPIRESFAISDTQYSLLAGLAFALFYAVMGLPLARIADSRNRRNLIAWGMAVWCVMTAVCGLARNFWTLFFARVGVGVGEAALGPAAYSMITDYFPRASLARALSVYALGVTIGSGAAYMLGGAVVAYVQTLGTIEVPWIGAVEGWQLTFFLVGLPGLAVVLLLRTTVAEPPRTDTAGNSTPDAASSIPVPQVLEYLWQRRRAYGCHIFGLSIFIMVVYALNLWGPTYFIRTFNFTVAEAGWSFGILMLAAGSAGLLFAGVVADKWLQRGVPDAYVRLILISMLCMLPCTLALGVVTSTVGAFTAMALAVFFSAFQGGISGGTLQLMTPNRMRGQVMAVYLLVANLIGLGLGPTALAATTDYVFQSDAAIGQSIALLGAVLCPLGALILWFGLRSIKAQISGQQQITSTNGDD